MKLNVALLFVMAGSVHGGGGKYLRPRKLAAGETCTPLIAEVEFEGRPGESHVACEFADGDILDVETEDGWDREVIRTGRLKSGTQDLECAGCVRAGSKLMIPPGQGRLIEKGVGGGGGGGGAGQDKRRRLRIGTRTVLAVRVVHSGINPLGAPTFNANELNTEVFSTDPGKASLRSQYLACSHDQLDFIPAAARNSTNLNIAENIVDGVTTVYATNTDCTGAPSSGCDGNLRNEVNSKLTSAFGTASGLANHVMHCMPPNVMNGIAYAYINSWNSVYKNNWCRYLSGLMHEIGHNINLAHSGEGGGTYDDQSGMMGYSYSQFDGPLMCFNAAKHWQLGWFNGYNHQFNVGNGSWSGTLMGISKIGNQPTNGPYTAVVKINDPSSSTDYYLHFNSKTGINSGAVEGGNQVTIVSQGGEGSGYATSTLLAKLNTGGSYTITPLSITITVGAVDFTAGTAVVTIAEPNPPTPSPSPGCSVDIDCDDSIPCTDDTCSGGQCFNIEKVCNPSNACKTNARCEVSTGQCIEDDINCDDGIFCNGVEECDNSAGCLTGTPVTCADDGLFCNGVEECDEAAQQCVSSGNPCSEGGDLCNGFTSCNEVSDQCETTAPVVCSDSTCGLQQVCNSSTGVCEDDGTGEDGVCDVASGEDCATCPNDCTAPIQAQCGNGVCESDEDCLSCAADCNGVTGGKPRNRYCCAGGQGGTCGDPRCALCDPTSIGGSSCCGDNVCEGSESFVSCPNDCSSSPTPPPPTPPTGCPVCPPTGQDCCGTCVDSGKPSGRGCF